MKYKHRWFLFFLPQILPSLQLTAGIFQKLSQPFTPLFLLGQISWKCSSNSLISGQMLDFFPFHHYSLLFFHLHLRLILWLRSFASAKATGLMGGLKIRIQRKKQCLTQKSICCRPWFWYCC